MLFTFVYLNLVADVEYMSRKKECAFYGLYTWLPPVFVLCLKNK